MNEYWAHKASNSILRCRYFSTCEHSDGAWGRALKRALLYVWSRRFCRVGLLWFILSNPLHNVQVNCQHSGSLLWRNSLHVPAVDLLDCSERYCRSVISCVITDDMPSSSNRSRLHNFSDCSPPLPRGAFVLWTVALIHHEFFWSMLLMSELLNRSSQTRLCSYLGMLGLNAIISCASPYVVLPEAYSLTR